MRLVDTLCGSNASFPKPWRWPSTTDPTSAAMPCASKRAPLCVRPVPAVCPRRLRSEPPRPLCASSAPARRPLGVRCVSALRQLCARLETALRRLCARSASGPLCVRAASALRPRCVRYASALRLLCVRPASAVYPFGRAGAGARS